MFNSASTSNERRWRSALTLALWATLVGVNGQHTEATCSISDLSWSFNSLKQSPCLITAYMANPCASNDDYDVPAIGPGFHYNPSQIPSICECSSVVYNLYSACAACQNATIGPWTLYSENCTQIWPDGQYLLQIPSGTALPAWAYQQIMGTNRLNLTEAQAVGDSPENKTTASATSSAPNRSLVPSGGGGGGSQTTGTASPANTSNNSGKKSTPVGPIVGGVVGGVGGLALIGGLLAFFLIRRKKSPSRGGYTGPAVSEYGGTDYSGGNHNVVGYNAGGLAASSVPQRSPATSPGPQGNSSGQQYTAVYQPVNPVLPSRPYDPEDPSTFPPTSEGPAAAPHAGPAWSTGEPTLIGSNQPLGADWYKDNHHEPRAEI